MSWAAGATLGVWLHQVDHRVELNIRDSAGGNHSVVSSNNLVAAGIWTHLVATYDRATGVGRFYKNGEIFNEWSFGVFQPGTAGELYMGARPGNATFRGQLDEVAVYSGVLPKDEIFALAHVGPIGRCPAGNLPPVVDAGADITTARTVDVPLMGTVTDDELPAGLGLEVEWTVVGGPGQATFADGGLAATTVTFSAPGLYTLQLRASDGLASAFDRVEVRAGSLCTETPTGLVGWWPANGDASDAVNGGPSVLASGATWAAGRVGQAFAFDGVNDAVEIPGSPALDVGTGDGFSIELWARPEVLESRLMVTWARGAALGVWLHQIDHRIELNVRDIAGGNHSVVSSNNLVAANVWTHLVATYDRTTGYARLYKNGELFNVWYLGSFQPRTDLDVFVGGRLGNASFRGQLDELSVYDHALNADAIWGLWIAAGVGKCAVDGNEAPVVDAGPSRAARSTADPVTLAGSASDDGRPEALALAWDVVEGPGTATFDGPSSPTPTVTFDAAGIWILRLTAHDGAITRSDTVEVRVGALCSETPAGVAAWWPGESVTDDVIGGANGVLESGATFAGGQVGQAFSFDGNNDRIRVPRTPALDVGQGDGFSIEVWVNPARLTSQIFMAWSDETNVGVWLHQIDHRIELNIRDSAGGNHSVVSSNNIVAANVWTHLVATYDRTTGYARLYKNGELFNVWYFGVFQPRTNLDVYIGGRPASPTMLGQLDELTLYSRALRPDEVFGLSSAGAIGKCPNDGNEPPVVDAGPDQLLRSAAGTITLAGTVTDDGGPSPLVTRWELVEGPGQLAFTDPASPSTTATVSVAGIYLLRLTADDGSIVRSDLVEVRAGALCAETPAGLTAWWPAEGDAFDAVGGLEGVRDSGEAFAPGKVNQAFDFDGTNDLIRVRADAATNIGAGDGSFSFELWARPSRLSSQFLLGWWREAGPFGVWLHQIDHRVEVNVRDTAGGNHFATSSNNLFAADTWVHILVTHEQPGGRTRLYKNGELFNEWFFGDFAPGTANDLLIGGYPGGAFYRGQLDEVSLYDRAIPPDEVYRLSQTSTVGKCPADGNLPPVVDAGPDVSVSGVRDTLVLAGTATDDGRPLPLQVRWEVLDGPGNVTFSDATRAESFAWVDAPGTYQLRLTANDGSITRSDLVEVRAGALCVESPQGLAAWWTADGDGSDALGTSPAVLDSGVAIATGQVNQAFLLDGTNDLIRVQGTPATDIAAGDGSFSFEVWVNPSRLSSQFILGWWRENKPLGVWLHQIDHRVEVNVRDVNGGDHFATSSNNFFATDTWVHILVTHEQPGGRTRLYKNGELFNEWSFGTYAPGTTRDLFIGGRPGSPAFLGKLDEVTLYDRAIPPDEAFRLSQTGHIGKCPVDGNVPPLVDAGPDVYLADTSFSALLNGTVLDDGLPANRELRVSWSVASGPGEVRFDVPNAPMTVATFSEPGIYILSLTADDGSAIVTDTLQARVDTACSTLAPTSLVGWWTGNIDGTDLAGAHDATMMSGLAITPGKIGGAFTFDGVNDGLFVPRNAALDVGQGNGFSIELWVKPVALTSQVLFAWSDTTTPGVWLHQIDHRVELNVRDINGGDHYATSANNLLTAGVWTHLVATYDRGTGVANLYKNGALFNTWTFGVYQPRTGFDVTIGQRPGSPFFRGQLDEVALYNAPLDPTEITALHQSQPGGKCVDLDGNLPPLVNAGDDASIPAFEQLALHGIATDDGLPGGQLGVRWQLQSGPDEAFLAAPNALDTDAQFVVPGDYRVRLQASDGHLLAWDELTVTVSDAIRNRPPRSPRAPTASRPSPRPSRSTAPSPTTASRPVSPSPSPGLSAPARPASSSPTRPIPPPRSPSPRTASTPCA